jgi:predicted nuclease with TOPRIM domain
MATRISRKAHEPLSQTIIIQCLNFKMAAPVKHTCPDIDKYIKYIKMCICKERDIKNMTEEELKDTCSAMNSQLEECIDYLEQLRSSNHQLREWGDGLDEALDIAESRIDQLENNLVI